MNKVRTSAILGFSMLIIGSGCTFTIPDQNQAPDVSAQPISMSGINEENKPGEEENTETAVSTRAKEVILVLKENSFEKLSAYIHPQKGVRFSPYVYIKKDSDLIFKADKVRNLSRDTNKYTWGSYDGSGFPIELTAKEYFEDFVYSYDFANVKEIAYNNTSNYNTQKVLEVYPDSIAVEYVYLGTQPPGEGMDWKTLRLVFEEFNGTWFLVGIVHDQWMI